MDPPEIPSDKERHSAYEVGCSGLVGGVAHSRKHNERIKAITAAKSDGPFICPECFSDAILRKCTEIRDHFAHKAPLSPIAGQGESALHKACKLALLDRMISAHPNGEWQAEREIKASPNRQTTKFTPDVSGALGDNSERSVQRVGFEVQKSTAGIPSIISRTGKYAAWNMPVMWVVPLTKPLPNYPFRPRLCERYFHMMYFGRVYYWWEGLGGSVAAVHLETEVRRIPYSEWYDEDGDQQNAGGYDKPYKVIKRPIPFAHHLDVAQAFEARQRETFVPDNANKFVPACWLWSDSNQPWW